MKLLKSTFVAVTLALSLGSFSTTATAVSLGMACMYNKMTPMEGIDALKLSKEINANDKLDRNRANDSLKKARNSVKDSDMVVATQYLKEAENRFSALKSMIDLTQADKVSQQTNLLNRIMDTPDPSRRS